MKKYDRFCVSDKGKQFVITQKGKENCKSLMSYNVGEKLDMYDVPCWYVDSEYVEEVDIPEWKNDLHGYVVGYYCGEHFLPCGNYQVFPKKKYAKTYRDYYQKKDWMKDREIVVKDEIYSGVPLPEVKLFYEGQEVIDEDHYFGLDAHEIGSLFCKEMISGFMDLLPPATMNYSLCQIGEASSHKIDDDGKTKATYATFVRITEDVWKYVGDCFKGKSEMTGKEIQYV